jgi:hypothetical protein
MSNIRQRLARLERSAPPPANVCAGCAHLSPITLHEEYTLTSGETILLPPLPDGPPCTCGRLSPMGHHAPAGAGAKRAVGFVL